jgi:hypothetical protein
LDKLRIRRRPTGLILSYFDKGGRLSGLHVANRRRILQSERMETDAAKNALQLPGAYRVYPVPVKPRLLGSLLVIFLSSPGNFFFSAA